MSLALLPRTLFIPKAEMAARLGRYTACVVLVGILLRVMDLRVLLVIIRLLLSR